MPKKTAKRLTAKRNKTMKSNPWATHVHMCMEKYGSTYKPKEAFYLYKAYLNNDYSF